MYVSLFETDAATSHAGGTTCQKETMFLIQNRQKVAKYHTHSGQMDLTNGGYRGKNGVLLVAGAAKVDNGIFSLFFPRVSLEII